MNANNRAFILVAVALLALLWLLRFDLQSTRGAAYRLDRWTGHVDFIYYDQILRVQPKREAKSEPRDLFQEPGLADNSGNPKERGQPPMPPEAASDKWWEDDPIVPDDKQVAPPAAHR